MKKAALVFSLLLLSAFNSKAQDRECSICERAERITDLIGDLSEVYWPEFREEKYRVPLFYFTDSSTYMMLVDSRIKESFDLQKVKCGNAVNLYKYKRIDNVPFHMENKMDIADKKSPYYRHSVMFCSDAETAKKLIPEVTNTEEWMAIVFHEYFHGFQFKHPYIMSYMADTLRESADTLISLYRKETWFKEALAKENEWLLKAINTDNKDSVKIYAGSYLLERIARRGMFKMRMGYNIASRENFWEKMEGTARYAEYNLAYVYMNAAVKKGPGCDNMFNDYQTYKKAGFENLPWMKDKTEIMAACYYVTGFNMCRLLDKLGVQYKDGLFDSAISLTEILAKNVK